MPIVGAVVLARRLQDPIAEMTKLEPKQIVGGHGVADVDPKRVSRDLREVVEQCVNRIGVDVKGVEIAPRHHKGVLNNIT